ncbi:MAG: PRC-barrel domain-containing protein [Armatimonadetes bacterium]|nr:PRC-barrel domain-containing protein [Armatimonadota bacterium]
METTAKTTLLRLSDSNLTVAAIEEDIRGRKVFDSSGEEIGHVDDLLIDQAENKVRFLQVASGGILGLGETKFLIPVDAIRRIDAEHVHIDQTHERVAGAPRYDPDLEDDSYYTNVYGYYGYAPYWGAGYVYPGYPYYL